MMVVTPMGEGFVTPSAPFGSSLPPRHGAHLAFDFDADTLRFRELGLLEPERRKRGA